MARRKRDEDGSMIATSLKLPKATMDRLDALIQKKAPWVSRAHAITWALEKMLPRMEEIQKHFDESASGTP